MRCWVWISRTYSKDRCVVWSSVIPVLLQTQEANIEGSLVGHVPVSLECVGESNRKPMTEQSKRWWSAPEVALGPPHAHCCIHTHTNMHTHLFCIHKMKPKCKINFDWRGWLVQGSGTWWWLLWWKLRLWTIICSRDYWKWKLMVYKLNNHINKEMAQIQQATISLLSNGLVAQAAVLKAPIKATMFTICCNC